MDTVLDNRASVRTSGDIMDSGKYFNREIVAKGGFAVLVMLDSCGELLFGLGTK